MNNIQKNFKAKSMLRKMADGGKVMGPGGPTDDKVDTKLSHGEYVLPADTVQAVGVDKLDALKNATHTPVEDMSGATHTMPRTKSALRLADGGPVGFDPGLDPILEAQKRAVAQHAAEMSAGQPAYPQATGETRYGAQALRSPPPEPMTPLSNSDRLAAESLQREQAASRAASRAAYAGPEAPTLGAKVAGVADAGASKLRAGLGAVGDFVKSPITKATGLARGLGAAAVVAPAAYQTVSGAGDSNYDQRFGIHNGNIMDNPVTRALVPSIVDTSNKFGSKLRGSLGVQSGSTADNLMTSATRLPIDMYGATTDFASNAANTAIHMIPGMGDHKIGFADQARMQDPVGTATNPGLQIIDPRNPASMSITPPSANAANPAAGAAGVDPRSVASSVDAGGNPVYDNASLLRMQARNGQQPAVTEQGPAAPAEDPVASALRSMLGNRASSVGMLNSRAGDINRHFDDLAKEIEKLHGGARFHANGELAGKLLDLEKARAIALGQDQGNLVGSQGNVASDASSLRQQQNNALDGMVQRANNNDTNTASQRNAIIAHQNDALKMRQEQSEKALAEAHAQALAQAPLGPDGKPDQAAAQKIFESLTNNYEPAVDGTPPTVGAAAERLAQASQNQSLRAMANEGSNNPSYQPVKELSNRHSPTFGEFLDHDTNIGLGDVARGVANDLGIPFVDSADVYDTDGSGDKVRARKLTPDQIDHARRQKILRGN